MKHALVRPRMNTIPSGPYGSYEAICDCLAQHGPQATQNTMMVLGAHDREIVIQLATRHNNCAILDILLPLNPISSGALQTSYMLALGSEQTDVAARLYRALPSGHAAIVHEMIGWKSSACIADTVNLARALDNRDEMTQACPTIKKPTSLRM